MEFKAASERRRLRVDRREAAKILHCSRDNIRRMDKEGRFKTSKRDRNGVFTYERREIEELAKQRGLQVRPSGELAARVFAMFKERRSLEDIVIATQQEPGVIQALWKQRQQGLDYENRHESDRDEERAQREHTEQMRAMDRELERQRRGVLFGDDVAPRERERPGLARARKEDAGSHVRGYAGSR